MQRKFFWLANLGYKINGQLYQEKTANVYLFSHYYFEKAEVVTITFHSQKEMWFNLYLKLHTGMVKAALDWSNP